MKGEIFSALKSTFFNFTPENFHEFRQAGLLKGILDLGINREKILEHA